MKILIVNQPLNNRGDESAHKALIRKLIAEIPNASIEVLWVGEDDSTIAEMMVKDQSVTYTNLPKPCLWNLLTGTTLHYKLYVLWAILPFLKPLFSIYKKADLVLCAPGGMCMGGFQNWCHLFFLQVAKYLGKKVAYYGRSIGPFPTDTPAKKRFKEISLDLLNYFSFISIRDMESEKLLSKLGIKCIPTVDTAFLDDTIEYLPKEVENIINPFYCVFVPNSLLWHPFFKGKLSEKQTFDFYSAILSAIQSRYNGITIVMLPQTYNYGSGADDINFFKKFAQFTKDKSIIVMSDKYSSDVQQAIIKGAEFVCGARYHSVVFSINQHRPFIALSYEHKIKGLLENLNCLNRMIDISDYSLLLEDKEIIKKKVLDILKMDDNISCPTVLAKKISNNCFNELKQFILKLC